MRKNQENGDVSEISPVGSVAVKGSIAHWKRIVAGEEAENGITNCALCEMFYRGGCDGCPVFMKTGQIECGGTPYLKWTVIQREESPGYFMDLGVRTPREKAAARAELRFLKSLLPRRSRT